MTSSVQNRPDDHVSDPTRHRPGHRRGLYRSREVGFEEEGDPAHVLSKTLFPQGKRASCVPSSSSNRRVSIPRVRRLVGWNPYTEQEWEKYGYRGRTATGSEDSVIGRCPNLDAIRSVEHQDVGTTSSAIGGVRVISLTW